MVATLLDSNSTASIVLYCSSSPRDNGQKVPGKKERKERMEGERRERERKVLLFFDERKLLLC